jgi:NAD(P)-dependent dehydrogenase (short-subunit alcohol dehydrogenase family)
MSDEEFDAVIDVHLRGTFTCVRAAVRHFREQGEGGPIVGMVRTWAMECERAGIMVNAVIPVAATAMTETMPAFAPYVTAWRDDGVPLPSWLRAGEGFGTPADAAGLVVFLASTASDGVTGQAIGVGGDKLSLWSHPTEVTAAYRDGGWCAPAVAETWRTGVGRNPESFGVPAPQVPA